MLRGFATPISSSLASRVAADGDRDGLPNVLMEAQSQGLACVATKVSAIPELIEDGQRLPGAARRSGPLAAALERLIREPLLRESLGRAGMRRVHESFAMEPGIERLSALFGLTEEPRKCASHSTPR